MKLRTHETATAATWLLLAGLAQASNPYPTRDQVCVVGCHQALSKYTFAGRGSTDAMSTACDNPLYFESLYACAQRYCPLSSIEPGIAYLSLLCKDAKFLPLPSYGEIMNSTTVEDLSTYRQLDATTKGRNLTSPVIPDPAFFALAQQTIAARAEQRIANKRLQNAVWIYWGAVLALATLANFNQRLWACHGRASAPAAYLRASMTQPCWTSLRASQPTPDRLETLLLAAFGVLSVVCFAVDLRPFDQSLLYDTWDIQVSTYVGRRFASLALANLPLVWLFGMRNNLLMNLTGWSFARFNQLHRWVARVAFAELVAHAGAFTHFELLKGGRARYAWVFGFAWWVWGLVAMVCVGLMMGLSSAWVRKRWYEAFLASHVVLAGVALVGIFRHVGDWHGYFDAHLWPVVAIWAFDRVLRLVRLVGTAVLGGRGVAVVAYEPDAHVLRVDVTSIVKRLKPASGTHYYLYTPTIFPYYASHPFTLVISEAGRIARCTSQLSNYAKSVARPTIAETNPDTQPTYTFLIKPQNGMTRRLARMAQPHERQPLPVLLEGPYAPSTRTLKTEHTLIITGGSGLSVGVNAVQEALDLGNRVRWICVDKTTATIVSVLENELAHVAMSRRLTLEIYATADPTTCGDGGGEKLSNVHAGRPDLARCINDSYESRGLEGEMNIVACGPVAMMADVQRAVAAALLENKSVSLKIENFCW